MMDALPNAAEGALAEAVVRMGGVGFEAALAAFLRRSITCNNIVIIAFRGTSAQLVYHQADDPIVFQDLVRTYLPGAYLLDPLYDLHLNRVAPGAYRLTDVAPDHFQRSQYYLEYYRQTTLTDELAFVSYPESDVTLTICLGRDASMPRPFGAQAREVAGRIAPVVASLADRHWREIGSSTRPPSVSRQLPADEPPTERLRRLLAERHAVRVSERQAQVALLILQGHSSVSIGLRLGVSPQTVKVFRRQLYVRCGISSQAELFALLLPLLTGSVVSDAAA